MKRILWITWASLSIIGVSVAQWSTDPTVNMPVCKASGIQTGPVSISDGVGGIVIAWLDFRPGKSGIYAQRFNAAGVPLWEPDGHFLVVGDNRPVITTDGHGGAIVAYTSDRYITAQRVDSSGSYRWGPDGVTICNTGGTKFDLNIVSDGAGGAVMAWTDTKSPDYDIYASRVNSDGVYQWNYNGTPICVAAGNQHSCKLTTDGTGGAVIVWADERNGLSNLDIWAQRIDGLGHLRWTSDGVPVCSATGDQVTPVIAGVDSVGSVIAWLDDRSGPGMHYLYAQRMSRFGARVWSLDGIPLCTAGPTNIPQIVMNDLYDSFVAWADLRAANYDVYAQRIDWSGAIKWMANGVPICTTPKEQLLGNIAVDSAKGVFITWEDKRNFDTGRDIYAQRVSSLGIPEWKADGIIVSFADGDQTRPFATTTAAAKVVIVWGDERAGASNKNIYCHRLSIPIMLIHWDGFPGPFGLELLETKVHLSASYSSGVGSGFDIKIVQYPFNPVVAESILFNPQTIAFVADRNFISIEALDVPQGASFLMDLSFDYDPAEQFGNVTPGPPPMSSLRIASRESSGQGGTGFDIDPQQQFYDPQSKRLTITGIDHFSEWAFAVIPETMSVNVQPGWNLLSVPLRVGDFAPANIYPGGTSTAFAYAGNYQPQTLLQNTIGFWMKFPSNITQQVTGGSFQAETVVVNARWNIIGGLSHPVAVSDIESIPPNEIISNFYGYGANGYTPADSLQPGLGYWVKMGQNGKLSIRESPANVPSARKGESSPAADVRSSAAIDFVDATGSRRTVWFPADGKDLLRYEVPPPPPGAEFDARISPEVLAGVQGKETVRRIPITMYGGKYPITFSAALENPNDEVSLVIDSRNVPLQNATAIVLEHDVTELDIVLSGSISDEVPVKFDLLQNYPNPFNPTTDFRFQIAEAGFVKLAVYDVLGRHVATIVNEELPPGEYTRTWDASAFPSGVYFYRLTAGPFAEVKKLLITK